ncbi:TetR family transcriptional regulator [Burkholderia cepacia JBK9]|uniref:TetR/AcrR family transcriptional regulator n=2 Tax=Burkholderia arboris TaxID=488730 RepID=A0ABZ3DWZ3_9BURK|nr:TetR/AcrR family transcriptional regulator [Burkholderia arboris]ALX16536.1 TetR family transcriptional regulator [Burkholderia cepacia JBK9]MCA8489629.1 TetR/AcrR family transcriptional regulator [Burkholderia arboris]UTV60393.1 TetR/AcrR family transcriptional regulator [Burkholderia arboris]
MSESTTIDHRTRVAAQRRERMRARLIESAMLVFAEKGIGASVIQDVIAAADVSQGTFYNYFRTNEELLEAVTQELNDELLRLIETVVGAYEDPARRIACGVRMFLYAARAYPLLARFISAAGVHAVGPSSLIYVYLPVHIQQGLATGRFQGVTVELALDMIAGTALTTIHRFTENGEVAESPEQIVAAILRGLGVDGEEARRLVLDELTLVMPPETSLLERGRVRAAKQPDARP